MRRSDDDNMPTCSYYPDKHCERPSRCPIHRPVLKRPRKPIHYLHAEKVPSRWDSRGKRLWWKTLCGVYLHPRLSFEKFYSDIYNDTSLTEGQKSRASIDLRMEIEIEGWKHAPIPSTDKRYEAFFVVGWSHAEAMVATTGRATCTRCLQSRKKKRLTIAKPCATYDVHEQAVIGSRSSVT